MGLFGHNWRSLLVQIATGGSSVFYYFFSLLVATLVSFVALGLSQIALGGLLIMSVLLLLAMPLLVMQRPSYSYLAAYWNPLNFVPYGFIAVLASRQIGRQVERIIWQRIRLLLVVIVAIFVLSSALEWRLLVHSAYFPSNGFALPAYTRVSAIAGASLLFFASLVLSRSPGRCVQMVSRYSLGLYCIHPFVLALTRQYVRDGPALFAVVLPVSYLATHVVMISPARRVIS
jgi:surface polysaccharide O-acyltransferase-like enzyme